MNVVSFWTQIMLALARGVVERKFMEKIFLFSVLVSRQCECVQAIREQAEQRARAQQEAFRGFRGFWGPDVGGPSSRRGPSSSSARAGPYSPQRGPRRYSSDSGGPIIDAEWTDVDAKK